PGPYTASLRPARWHSNEASVSPVGEDRCTRRPGVNRNPVGADRRIRLADDPVSDVDRAKAFYAQAGFGNLHDTQVTETMRVVQLTPPGSSCAIVFGTGMGPISEMAPGSVKGLHLVV